MMARGGGRISTGGRMSSKGGLSRGASTNNQIPPHHGNQMQNSFLPHDLTPDPLATNSGKATGQRSAKTKRSGAMPIGQKATGTPPKRGSLKKVTPKKGSPKR